jgi:hypothetical protein
MQRKWREPLINLRQAIEQDKLDQFIAERKGETGDPAQFERIIRSMAGTSKEAPEASSPDDSDD